MRRPIGPDRRSVGAAPRSRQRINCTGGLLAPLTYAWPSKDPRYTYRAQLVDSTGTVRRTDNLPESGQSPYS